MAELIRPAWLPEGLYNSWLTAYTEAGGESTPGSANYATEVIRASAEYDSYFPGLRREDGSLRYQQNPERTYYDNIEGYKNTVENIGINPDLFGEEYIDLIEGDTSPSEFASRADALYARVLSTGNDIRDWYASNYGLNMTNEGILASLMSDRVSNAVLDRQITMAEIGGEAAMRDFDITTGFVNMLEEQGMNRSEAQKFFGSAETLLPALNRLAARHGDVDDDFDIMEYAQAEGLTQGDSGNQMQRLKRLQAQEVSTFTGSAATDIVRGPMGGMTGLVDV
jgi:hypothetical protein